MKMQHRVALAVIISIAILIGNYLLFPPPAPEEGEGEGETAGEVAEADTEGAAEPADPANSGPEVEPASAEPAPDPVVPADEAVDLVEHELRNELVALRVDNQPGGLLTGVEPLAEQFRDLESERGIDFLLLDGARTLEFAFVADETGFDWARIPATVTRKDERSIELGRRQGDIEVVESLTLLEGYEARYAVTVRNLGAGSLKHRAELSTRMGLAAEKSRYDIHRGMCRSPDDLEEFDYDDVEDETEKVKGGVDWIALDSKYFAQAVVPRERLSGCVVSSDDAGTMMIIRGVGREIDLGPGETARYEFGVFVGAKVDSMLADFPTGESLSELPEVDLSEVIDWGWFGGLSRFLGGMMLDLLRWFYSLTGIWGVSIILLTVVIKLILLPLTIKQYRSMRKMKVLQPEMEKLREKYKDDRAKQQQEMQALFQRTGINPLAGCMPMVLQFPVWIALYAMLGAVVDLYHESFLWLPDLTQPDPFYILPIAMGALMFVQTRMNPTAGDAQQMKMMQWLMPGIFVVMMLFLPSGLGVYIFANITLSLVQSFIQLRVRGKDGDAGAKPDAAKA